MKSFVMHFLNKLFVIYFYIKITSSTFLDIISRIFLLYNHFQFISIIKSLAMHFIKEILCNFFL